MHGRDKWSFTVIPPPALSDIERSHRLTPRQAQVAVLLYWRRTDKEIAVELGISVKTAATHAERVLSILGVGTRRHVECILHPRTGMRPMR